MSDKPRLGRGLDALLGGAAVQEMLPASSSSKVSVTAIETNPYQPRKTFDEDDLRHLGDSIRTHGVLQPLVVRQVGESYQLIAGERRLRAARAVGLSEVPVHVVDFNDQQVLEAALVENVQRADLNPIEKAQGFKEYLDRFSMTHEQLAQRLGLDRSTITNLLGLLNLPPEVQDYVRLGQISLGHAKVLKGLSEPERQVGLCKEVISKSLSVHALEQLVKQQRAEAAVGKAAEEPASEEGAEPSTHVRGIEDELRQRLTVRVAIKLKGKHKGQIVLGFETNDDFERIVEALRR
jgi:ParB family chromosome partitioning protein